MGPKPKLNAGQLIAAYYEEGSVEAACTRLGICRKTFHNTMKRLGLTWGERRIHQTTK